MYVRPDFSPIAILRFDQVGGPTTDSVKWESKTICSTFWPYCSGSADLFRTTLVFGDWIPVDLVSRVIRDITFQKRREQSHRISPVRLYNLVHLKPIPFARFADALQTCIPSSKQLGLSKCSSIWPICPRILSPRPLRLKIWTLRFFQCLIDAPN